MRIFRRRLMRFEQALRVYPLIVANGPLGTRLKYDYGFNSTNGLTETPEGRRALSELYRGDIDVALAHNVPIIANAATFRASRNHLQSAGFSQAGDVERINISSIQFLKALRNDYRELNALIYIGAPIGTMHDAYSVDSIPTVEQAMEYHQEQIAIFKNVGVDFVNAVTISNLPEALGIALVADRSELPYTIGFILSADGKLLDGTPLDEAIAIIDARTTNKPLGYMITCTHASVIERLTTAPEKYRRLIGIQPNGSALSPKELAALKNPQADSPEVFSSTVMELQRKLNLKIACGCCGTSREHLKAIVEKCSPKQALRSKL